jgi:hypothetical protein
MNLYKVVFMHIPANFYIAAYDRQLAINKAFEKLRDEGYHDLSLQEIEYATEIANGDQFSHDRYLS